MSLTRSVAASESDFGGILDLLETCSRASPYPLAELLIRYGRTTSEFTRQWLICRSLGVIASWPHVSVSAFLEEHTKAVQWRVKLDSTLSLFKIFVGAEGPYRFNNKGKQRTAYDVYVRSLTAQMASPELLICSLAFASILSGPGIGAFSQPFADDYARLQKEIEAHCLPYLSDDTGLTKAETLKKLIQTHDYVGICVLLAMDIQDDARKHLREALIDACCVRAC